ncbi:MAG: hypothetical protein R3E31_20730 [Chloroflexota bacterium]
MAAAGIALMLQDFNVASLFSALLAFLTGLSVVASRIINGVLAKETTPSFPPGTTILWDLGFPLWFWHWRVSPGIFPFEITTGNLWMFTGGFLGGVDRDPFQFPDSSYFCIFHGPSIILGQFSPASLDTLLKDFFSPLEFWRGSSSPSGSDSMPPWEKAS